MFINLAIVVNAVVIGLETDYSCHSTKNCVQSEFLVWNVFEYLFLIIFLVEMVLKVLAYKWKGYWGDDWNKFDFTLVMLACVDILVMGVIMGGGEGKDRSATR